MVGKLIKSSIKTLRVLKESGVTDNLTKFPINRFEIKESKKLTNAANNLDNIEIMNSKTEKQLSKVNTIDELKTYIEGFKGCPLHKDATNAVFSDGNPKSKIMLIGEAPGHDEDIEGKPFVGRSGKLLDKILDSIDLNREKVFILNVLKCRPPKNRNPKPSEIEKCEPFLKKQLEIIKPKLIIALGRISAITLLRKKDSLKDMRNKIHKYEGIDLIVTYHPAALLRNPNYKKPTWDDFSFIRDEYLNGK